MTLATDLLIAPTTGGTPTGIGGWHFIVEQLTAGVWVDLTPWFAGCQWDRGASGVADPNPQTGVAELSLVDPLDDVGRFEPERGQLAEGLDAPIRWGIYTNDAGDGGAADPGGYAWLPQFTGIIEAWSHQPAGGGAVGLATLTLIETTAALARVDDFALTNPVGEFERSEERLDRLLTDVWPFGLDLHPECDATLFGAHADNQVAGPGTTLAQNRLGEIKELCEAYGQQVRSKTNGQLLVAPHPLYLFAGVAPQPSPLAPWQPAPAFAAPLTYLTITDVHLYAGPNPLAIGD